jgi:hypothetical protein
VQIGSWKLQILLNVPDATNQNSNTMCAWNAAIMTAKKSLKRLEDNKIVGQALNLPIFFIGAVK